MDVVMDGRGRIVIPLAERHRLGISAGAAFRLVPTAEGVILELRRRSTVDVAGDQLPLGSLDGDVEPEAGAAPTDGP
jgi:bifunctional DNA-binding transcriptional regulator/antitoxin component of YhaV-PrlF toxin-antitoxin module